MAQPQGTGRSFLEGRIWALGAELQLERNRILVREHTLQSLVQQIGDPNAPSSSAATPMLGGLPEASIALFQSSEVWACRKANLLVCIPIASCYAVSDHAVILETLSMHTNG